jgi:hypothetical protein
MAAKSPRSKKSPPNEPVLVEISKSKLEELLKSQDLVVGKNVRVVKTLEIAPGAVMARQYDR